MQNSCKVLLIYRRFSHGDLLVIGVASYRNINEIFIFCINPFLENSV